MKAYNIYKNEKFKSMYDVEHEKWKYGYNIYAQNVEGNIFVTFFDGDYTNTMHFNDSGSIHIYLYTKVEILQEMIETAKKLGWVSQ